MRRCVWMLILIAPSLLVACTTQLETAEEPIFTIGILSARENFVPVVEGFQQGMEELGYEAGVNVEYVMHPDGVHGLEAYEVSTEWLLAQYQIDAFFAVSQTATTGILAVTDEKPIVMALLVNGSEVDQTYVESVERPGGPLTGVYDGPVAARRLELLSEMFPEVERVYLPIASINQSEVQTSAELQPLADELGLELVLAEMETADDIPATIEAMPDDIDAIFTLPTRFPATTEWGAAAIERGIPYSHVANAQEEGGAVFSFGPNFFANGKLAATKMDQVLQGSSVSEVPMQTGEFFLTINLQTAEAAGLEIGDEFLLRANMIVRLEE